MAWKRCGCRQLWGCLTRALRAVLSIQQQWLWLSQLNSRTAAAATAAKSLQSCPTLCDPIDGSPPGSPIPGILQTRTLEWVPVSFSNAWKWKVKVKSLSHVQLLAAPWTAAHQAPLSVGFSRQEYWSGEPVPSPELKNSLLQISTEIFSPVIMNFVSSYQNWDHF